jgi:hypothetical protein
MVFRTQVSVLGDTGLPGDALVVTPHFSDETGVVNPDTLAQALATNTLAYIGVAGYVTAKVYEEKTGLPNYPLSTKTAGTAGTPVITTAPREIALCLSYYAGFNRPRFRGRLYIPWTWVAKHVGAGTTPGLRPVTGQMDGTLDFASVVLKPLKSTANASWCVYSTVDHTHGPVTNYYCDDEWDTQRRRGLKPTSRRVGVVT